MRTIEEIYGAMAEEFRARTGQEPGKSGPMAARLYAVAAQIYALEAQGEWTARQCFPQTAAGEHLERHAQLRGLERRAAAKATGAVRFSVDTPATAALTIPVGTVCMTAAAERVETTAAGSIPVGGTQADVPARAVEPGTGGNVGAGTVVSMAVAPVGVSRCTNPAAFAGGQDPESDEALRTRVLDSYRRLPNGANAAFYLQGAMSFPEVAAANVLPRNRGAGTVDVVIATAAGLPDGALLARVREYFKARREIAVDVSVISPSTKSVNVSVNVAPAAGFNFSTVKEKVESAVRGWFTGARLGSNIRRADLCKLIYSVEGVSNYKLNTPSTDVLMAPTQLPRMGILNVTLLEGAA